MASSDNVAEALFNCLITAETGAILDLADEVKAYKDTYFREGIKMNPLARKFFNAMEEAVQYNKEMEK